MAESNASGTAVRFSIKQQQQVRAIREQDLGEAGEEIQFVRSVEEIIQGASGAPQKIIPKQENTWQPEKLMRQRNLISTPEDNLQQFVSEVIPAGPVNGAHYGLSLRSGSESRSVEQDMAESRELRAKLDKQVLENHLRSLPESPQPDAYEAMPVEGFGQALLAGMGWKEGRGVGKRATTDVKAFEFVKRPERLGLGATPAPKESKTKMLIKPGETRELKPDLVAPVGPDGKVRHRIEIGEKLVERVRKGVYGGKVMSIITGLHAGLQGEVQGRAGDSVSVKLTHSGEVVQVLAKDLAEVGSLEEEKALKKLEELRIAMMEVKSQRPWLASQIRVRLVGEFKVFRKGTLYLKTARVLDVVTPTVCNLLLDGSGELVEGVKQESLETVVPESGERVLIVDGEHRGGVGTLFEKDGKRELAVVRIEESFEMVQVKFEHLTEYTGDAAR